MAVLKNGMWLLYKISNILMIECKKQYFPTNKITSLYFSSYIYLFDLDQCVQCYSWRLHKAFVALPC